MNNEISLQQILNAIHGLKKELKDDIQTLRNEIQTINSKMQTIETNLKKEIKLSRDVMHRIELHFGHHIDALHESDKEFRSAIAVLQSDFIDTNATVDAHKDILPRLEEQHLKLQYS